ncbi:hypothetical protein BD770DRAFT_405442 [Pilaira anomala]|nr:hypothetical protein BD770DRAFT_405442 [Pilaira anomala]
MVRQSSKPSLVPGQASPTQSSRTRTRPAPHVPARASFYPVQTPTVLHEPPTQVQTPATQVQTPMSEIETPPPKIQTPAAQIQTPKSKFSTPPSQNLDFSHGDKRPFSVVSPSLFGDPSSVKPPSVSPFQLKDIKDRLKRLEDAYAEIFTLRNALEHSESARRALESQVVQLRAAQQGSSSKSAPPPPTSKPAPPPPATKPAQAPKSKAKAKKPPSPSPRRAAATLGRLFGPKAGTPSEYHYLYYPQAVRYPLKQLRSILKTCGVNVSRILDIQYPDAKIVSFLVHADYVVEFTSQMHKTGRGAMPEHEYDPHHPDSLKDPKFNSLSFELRAQKAREIQNTRCLRSLSFVRRSARLSVARSFLHYQRINQTQFDVILAQERASRPSPPPLSHPKLSPEEVVEKKKHLAYLGYLLHLDHEAAHSLAYAPPLVDESMMSD